MRLIKLVPVFGIAAMLAACGTPQVGSVGGESRVITAPEYSLKGATPYDQEWIDETTEAGIAGLGWKRPKPRPASFDAKPVVKAAAPKPATFKERWWRKPTA